MGFKRRDAIQIGERLGETKQIVNGKSPGFKLLRQTSIEQTKAGLGKLMFATSQNVGRVAVCGFKLPCKCLVGKLDAQSPRNGIHAPNMRCGTVHFVPEEKECRPGNETPVLSPGDTPRQHHCSQRFVFRVFPAVDLAGKKKQILHTKVAV